MGRLARELLPSSLPGWTVTCCWISFERGVGMEARPELVLRTIDSTIEAALLSGALEPINTTIEVVEDAGVRFQLRQVDSLERKRRHTRSRPPGFNPFLPPEPGLFVAELSASHRCLLNKFPVLSRHLLVVPRTFEDQRQLLTVADFAATWPCLELLSGLAFYNGGLVAGASQRHKHLQVVPLPLVPGEAGVPIAAAEVLPFRHARRDFAGVPDPVTLHACYVALLQELALWRDDGWQVGPYNLLLTRSWMLVVPRIRESWKKCSVNALGFAGALLVKNEARAQRVRDAGPMRILCALAGTA